MLSFFKLPVIFCFYLLNHYLYKNQAFAHYKYQYNWVSCTAYCYSFIGTWSGFIHRCKLGWKVGRPNPIPFSFPNLASQNVERGLELSSLIKVYAYGLILYLWRVSDLLSWCSFRWIRWSMWMLGWPVWPSAHMVLVIIAHMWWPLMETSIVPRSPTSLDAMLLYIAWWVHRNIFVLRSSTPVGLMVYTHILFIYNVYSLR